MKTILTIDFDIIMGPSIELYNNIVKEQFWETNNQGNNSLLNFVQADLNLYRKITDFILKAKTEQNIPIYFITNHHEIIQYIPKEEELVLINIDHHHDCGYEKDKSHITCGNWVYYLKTYYKLLKYIWIHNPNSIINSKEISNMINLDIDINYINFNNYLNVDYIVISFSPEWIPINYRPLFKIWSDLIDFY